MKTCKTCGVAKQLKSGFYKLDHMPDGYFNECKVCWKARVIRNRTAKIEQYRAYDRERGKLPHRLALSKRQCKTWRAADKRRSRCHVAVARAIQNGLITKHPCVSCGETKSLAHHESYDHALDVIWLCQPCHKARHAEMKLQGKVP